MPKSRVLVVDDEAGIRSFIEDALRSPDVSVTAAADGLEAEKLLTRRSFHVMVTDLKMPGMDGLTLLGRSRVLQPELEVIVLTAFGTVENAVEAMKQGAFDYLTKPLSGPDELRIVVDRALERRRLRASRAQKKLTIEPMFGASTVDPAMKAVVSLIEKVAPTDATVLLTGESGTGKEVAARSIHRLSSRKDGPFVAVNCAALSEQLLESELFGHERGAFTGAVTRRLGRFELADGGTLFLDELAELRPPLQAKLLRVLQERVFERVGGSQLIDVDVRVIAATNRDLDSRMAEGAFRHDLYHRIAVFPVHLPPLRQRPADILPLADEICGRLAAEMGRVRLQLTKSARDALKGYEWPGNIRELANVLERAIIVSEDSQIDVGDLGLARVADNSKPVELLKDVEKRAVERALAATGGHREKAAQLLGIGLRTLYDKIRVYNLRD